MSRQPNNAAEPMAPHFLTAASIALLPTTGVQYRVRDAGPSGLAGFAVQVSRTGLKTYTLDFRVRGSRRSVRMSFGRYPAVMPTIARREAGVARMLALTGRDPSAERVAEAEQSRVLRESARLAAKERRDAAKSHSQHTVLRIARDYVRDRRSQLKESTVSLYEFCIARNLTGTFGELPVACLTQSDVRELLRMVGEGRDLPGIAKTKRSTGGEGAARTLRRFLRSLWTYALEERQIVSGPCPVPSAKRLGLQDEELERFLTAEECARLMDTLNLAEAVGIPSAPKLRRKPVEGPTAKHRPKVGVETPLPADPIAVAALRFVLRTGWRRGEVVSLRWDMIRKDLGVIILPDTKSGKSVRAVAPGPLAILDGLPRLVGSPWCFPSPTRPKKHIGTLTRLWSAVRHHAQIPSTRLHDLRHTAASLAINAGASLVEVQSMLGHNSARATARYAKLIPATGLRAAEKLAAVLDAAVEQHPGAKTPVTPITKGRRRRA